MIKNLIFDFGAVLIDWNPHYLYDAYLGSREKADEFLTRVCDMDWNLQMDSGRPFAETIPERVALFPEWEDAIRVYETRWQEMIGGEINGMFELLNRLTLKGIPLFGLTNWSRETFPPVRVRYARIFNQLQGYVVSGEEGVVKPDAQIYKILLDKYHLLPEECLFIDDSMKNILGARAVGMQAFHFQGVDGLCEYLEGQGIL